MLTKRPIDGYDLYVGVPISRFKAVIGNLREPSFEALRWRLGSGCSQQPPAGWWRPRTTSTPSCTSTPACSTTRWADSRGLIIYCNHCFNCLNKSFQNDIKKDPQEIICFCVTLNIIITRCTSLFDIALHFCNILPTNFYKQSFAK